MTDAAIELELNKLVVNERRITRRIVELLALAEERKIYLERGYSSMHHWLTKHFHYSDDAAHRRIAAARLVRTKPETSAKIESGEVNITTLAKAQSLIRKQEKASGRKVDQAQREKVLEAIENKSTREAEQALFVLLPDAAEAPKQERRASAKASGARLHINLDAEALGNLEWIKSYLSHSCPDGSDGEVIARVLADFRRRCENSAAKKHRAKKERCEFCDETTGQVCGSTYQVQEDHIIPLAQGGSDTPDNKRFLCRAHNLFEAERKLGVDWANAWRKKASSE